LQGCIPEKEDE